MFSKILIANRCEIACRVIRTATQGRSTRLRRENRNRLTQH